MLRQQSPTLSEETFMNSCSRISARLLFLLLPVALAAIPGFAEQATGPEIKVGGIFDLTGITSDVGKTFAQAVRDAVEWTNNHGGINGKRIKLLDVDYGYKIPEAVAAYKRMVSDDKVVMISGWGTGDTEALKEFIIQDKIPYISGSFSASLTDPSKTPYNFFVAPTYSDELRAWLAWVKDDWKDKAGRPKVAFLYGDNAYGRSPMEAGRQYAKEVGIDVVDEEILPGNLQDATSQLLNIQRKGADYAYINVTTTGVSIVLKDAAKLGLSTKFGSNPWGFNESLATVARGAAEGATGAMPHVPYGTEVPGMKRIVEFNQGKTPKVPLDCIYIRGWASVLVWTEALRRADKAGHLSGEGIKNAFETLDNFDLGGLTSNVTYTPSDHRATTKTAIYMIKNGSLAKVKEYEMPRKKEWLGL
jgi:branched-chain amino acid transport system substrate-binding protein